MFGLYVEVLNLGVTFPLIDWLCGFFLVEVIHSNISTIVIMLWTSNLFYFLEA